MKGNQYVGGFGTFTLTFYCDRRMKTKPSKITSRKEASDRGIHPADVDFCLNCPTCCMWNPNEKTCRDKSKCVKKTCKYGAK